MTTCLFAGTFDPVTFGHLDLIGRAGTLFDEVIVGIATNIKKSPIFTLEQRMDMIEASLEGVSARVEPIDGLLVDEAVRLGCGAILRGLRSAADLEYEAPMTHMNRALTPEVETVFLFAQPHLSFTSSSLVKEVSRFGGDISRFVPAHVAKALKMRYGSGAI